MSLTNHELAQEILKLYDRLEEHNDISRGIVDLVDMVERRLVKLEEHVYERCGGGHDH